MHYFLRMRLNKRKTIVSMKNSINISSGSLNILVWNNRMLEVDESITRVTLSQELGEV